MINVSLNDKELFGNDAGEDEKPEILDSYFIDLPEFSDFYNIRNRICVVSSRKGMGKSALLSRASYKINKEQPKDIIIKTTGNSLLGMGEFEGKDPAFLENYWKQIICRTITIEIGKEIGFAFSDHKMTMVETAEYEGMKNRNIVGALTSRIKGKIPTLNIETQNTFPKNWSALISSYQKKNADSNVWLFVDDIDAKFIDNEDYRNRIGSFFTSIRALTKEVNNLFVRVSVRTDIWHNLSELEDLDKWEQYIININWKNNQLREMLSKRILSYIQRNFPGTQEAKYDHKYLYDKLFDLVFVERVKWGGKTGSIFVPIKVFSNRRPRWMGQLCRMAGQNAYEFNNKKINLRSILSILTKFGQFRKNDLIKEHKHQYKDIDKLIDTFRNGKRDYTITELTQLLTSKYVFKKGAGNIPEIDGMPYSSPDQLGAFLYKIGFLNNSHHDEYQTTSFYENPDLFNSQVNRSEKLLWTIHSSYRSFLGIKAQL